jgi:hypothetical protein
MSAEQPDDYQSMEGNSQPPTPLGPRASQSEASAQSDEQLPDDPSAFVDNWIRLYLDGSLFDESLWEWFQEEFSGWTKAMFSKATHRASLRDLLRANGVYVAGGRGASISNNLYRLTQEEVQAVWTHEEKEKEITRATNLSKKWNSRWDPLVIAAVARHYQEAEDRFPGLLGKATTPRPSTQQQERVLPSIEQPIQPAVRFSTARDPPPTRPPLRDDSHDLYNDDPRPPRNLNRASYHEREQSTPSQSRFPIALPNVSGRNNLQTAPLVQTAPIVPLVAPTSVQSTYDSGRAIINLMKIYESRCEGCVGHQGVSI